MFILRFHLFAVAIACALLAGCGPSPTSPASAGSPSSYPNKAITLICPWAAGGGTDRVARFLGEQLQKELGQPVVLVNRVGGSGAVGHSAGALAKPDGYTITMGTFELSTMHWMGISQLSYKDYQPLLQVNADAAAILVGKDAPWNTLGDLLAYIQANPGKLRMSGTATGGAWDLARAGLLLKANLPVNSILWVPAQGSAPSLVELLGGHIDAVCCSVPEAAAQIEAKQLKVLAVMSSERLPNFPDLPTAKEQGQDWEAIGWRGLLLPRQTPAEIVERLEASCRKIVESDGFKEFMKKNGFSIVVRGPREFADYLAAQDAQWEKVIEAAGYKK